MTPPEPLALLVATSAGIAALHAVAGPDHYLPFIALGQARGWSLGRQVGVALLCGLGHVAASLLICLAAIRIGATTGLLPASERLRGEMAGWLLLGFGIAYTVWGVRQIFRKRPHSHWHVHADGTAHRHRHDHRRDHAHVHVEPGGVFSGRRLTPWLLFLVFVLGPCEPLIPLLLYAAAAGGAPATVLVAATFTVVTLVVMGGAVLLGALGLAFVEASGVGRYAHALAGLALVACGVAVRLGF